MKTMCAAIDVDNFGRILVKNLKLTNMVSITYLFFLLALFLLLTFSCKTAPKTVFTMPDEADSIPLDSGAFGYIFADVQNSKSILQYINLSGMNDDKQFQQMLDSTQFAVIAVYSPQSPRRYQLATWGNYPSSRAKMALGASKGWKKMRSTASKDWYWHNDQQRLSIAINPKQAFVLAVRSSADASVDLSTDPFSAAPGVTVPEDFGAFSKDAVFSCWFDNPGPIINQKIQAMGIPFEFPAQRFFISLFPVDEKQQEEQRYQTRLKLQFSNEIQARGLATVFNIARNFLSPQANSDDTAVLASILFANPPVLDGKNLNISTAALSGRELALLFNIFSL
jgi:hypothetical protein